MILEKIFNDICDELSCDLSLCQKCNGHDGVEKAVLGVIQKYLNNKKLSLTVICNNQITSAESVCVFGRRKSPDIVIKNEGEPFIAIEVKLRNTNDWKLSRAIGQAITYSAKYPYGIIFIQDSFDKNRLVRHDYDEYILSSLRERYNIKLIVRYDC